MEPTKIIDKVHSSCRDIREGCPSRSREMWHQGRTYWKPRGRNKMAEVRDLFDHSWETKVEKPRLYFRKNHEAMSQATKEKTNFRKRVKFCNRTPQIVEVNIKKYLLFFDIRNAFTTIFWPNCELENSEAQHTASYFIKNFRLNRFQWRLFYMPWHTLLFETLSLPEQPLLFRSTASGTSFF